jgi:hypothetical protein
MAYRRCLSDESRVAPRPSPVTRDARTYGSELGQVPIACEFNCPNAPVDTPGLLPDTNGDTWGVWRLMPGFPGSSGSPTAAELSGEHSLAGTLGSLIAPAGAAARSAAAATPKTTKVLRTPSFIARSAPFPELSASQASKLLEQRHVAHSGTGST